MPALTSALVMPPIKRLYLHLIVLIWIGHKDMPRFRHNNKNKGTNQTQPFVSYYINHHDRVASVTATRRPQHHICTLSHSFIEERGPCPIISESEQEKNVLSWFCRVLILILQKPCVINPLSACCWSPPC
jgi:hypothetical protein